MFKPILVEYIILWKKEPDATFNKAILSSKSQVIDNEYLKDLEIFYEHDYIIINLQMNIKPIGYEGKDNGWVEIEPKHFKKVFNQTKKLKDKWFNIRKIQRMGLKQIGDFQMIITGAEDEYWTKSRIDIHKFKIDSDRVERSLELSDVEAENNLAIFNRMLFGGKRIFGDRLENLKLPTFVYGLGINGSDDFQNLPRSFLLSLTVNKEIRGKEINEVENKQFRLTVNSVMANFGRLVTYLAKLMDLYSEEYISINKRSNEVREKALKLQMKINNLLVTKSDSSAVSTKSTGKRKRVTAVKYSYHGMEEHLLLEASRYLSYLTEINQFQAQANYERQEASANIEKINQTLGMTPIAYLSKSNNQIQPLSNELKQLSDFINHNFQNLKIELDHSQSTIRNTVDILKTFLESEQRIVSQRSSEAINWIVIVFAGLGLADALGNFVIFYLEGGKWYQAMFWFFFIMIILIIVVVTLYFWYFKRPKYLGSKST